MEVNCHRKSQQARRDSRNNKSKDNQTSNSEESALMWDMMGLDHDVGSACSTEPSKASSISTIAGSSVAVPNMIFDGTKGWQARPPDSHPMLPVTVRTDASDYGHINRPDPKLRHTILKQLVHVTEVLSHAFSLNRCCTHGE